MGSETSFEYESDWVEYFNAVLRNEIRDEIDNKNAIKANIVESNQTLEEFISRNSNMEIIPKSKESFFHNIRIRKGSKEIFFYINNENPRFWTVHNIEKQKMITGIINEFTTNTFQQDKIYLSNETMELHQKTFNADSLGLTLNFEQKFTEIKDNPVFSGPIKEFDDIGYTLQLWPKHPNSINFFLEQFRYIKCPINYRSLNYVFKDIETEEVLIKEDLHSDGSFTIHRGKDIKQHLNFLESVKEKYANSMEEVEEYRFNWLNSRGELFTFSLDKKINPKNFINAINQANEFKINCFFMYKENGYLIYNCIDLHTGGKFYIQINPEEIHIFLEEDSCGNIIFRFAQNLHTFFSVTTELMINEEKLEI